MCECGVRFRIKSRRALCAVPHNDRIVSRWKYASFAKSVKPRVHQKTMLQPKCHHPELQASKHDCSCTEGSCMPPYFHLRSGESIRAHGASLLKQIQNASEDQNLHRPVSLRIFPSKAGSAVAAATETVQWMWFGGILGIACFTQSTKQAIRPCRLYCVYCVTQYRLDR